MTDTEKVIIGLKKHANDKSDCPNCPYWSEGFVCTRVLIHDTLNLLKKQDPKPPKVTENAYGTKFYFCPHCARPIIKSAADGRPRYCEDCGQAVKWG